ncbi:MAG: mycothiol system anti-sigma-R factor [Actinomycetota bacterium]|nr:mycothiol system anti-sigma-R factor [Actinomycetota bacterium]
MGDDGRARCGGGKSSHVGCQEAVRQLYVYLDGELTEERRLQIAVHLDECGPCADAAGFEAELRAVVSSRCKDRVPDSLIARVAAAIAAEAELSDPTRPSGAS